MSNVLHELVELWHFWQRLSYQEGFLRLDDYIIAKRQGCVQNQSIKKKQIIANPNMFLLHSDFTWNVVRLVRSGTKMIRRNVSRDMIHPETYLTQQSLKELAAKDSRNLAHTGLQSLFLWAGQTSLILPQQPNGSLSICKQRERNLARHCLLIAFNLYKIVNDGHKRHLNYYTVQQVYLTMIPGSLLFVNSDFTHRVCISIYDAVVKGAGHRVTSRTTVLSF